MISQELRESIRKITRDRQMDIEERIRRVFQALDDLSDASESDEAEMEIAAYSELIEMIKEEDESHEFDSPYLRLITLLAEEYVKLKDYRKLKNVALDTLELLRRESTPFEYLEETIPRIASAVEYSVYNHYLFEILLRFVKEADRNGKLDEDLKYETEQVLKLNLLLRDNEWTADMLDKSLVDSMTRLFTAAELMKIILNPSMTSLKVDPVEYTWEWENIYYDVEDELDKRLAGIPRRMGFCYPYWSAKTDLLKNKYNIEWNSPSKMNPGTRFD